jgi:predicted phage terminase large subunit-like protein
MVDIYPSAKLRKVRVWDLAATEDGGDYTTGALCGYDSTKGHFYVLNIIRQQLNPGEVEKLVLKTAVADGLDTEIVIEQEPGSAGKALVEHYNKTVLTEFKVTPLPATLAKVIRAQPMLAGAEAGHVFLVQGGWNDTFINEFDTFPGIYDDQVDTVGAGYTFLTGKKVYSATWGSKSPATHIVQANKKARAAQFGLASSTRSSATWGQT